MKNPPKIFRVNWFRTTGSSSGPASARTSAFSSGRSTASRGAARRKTEETDIGYVPTIDAIDRTGLEISDDAMRQLLRVDRADWIEVVQGQRKYFEKFGDHLPAGIGKEHEALARRVAA